jgi:hypothetical protein
MELYLFKVFEVIYAPASWIRVNLGIVKHATVANATSARNLHLCPKTLGMHPESVGDTVSSI